MSASGVRPACRAVRPARGVTPRRLATWLSHAKKKSLRHATWALSRLCLRLGAWRSGEAPPCRATAPKSYTRPRARTRHTAGAHMRAMPPKESYLCLHYSRHRLRCIGWLVREHAPAMAKFYFLYSSSSIVTDHRCIPHEFDSRDSKGQCHASTYSLSK